MDENHPRSDAAARARGAERTHSRENLEPDWVAQLTAWLAEAEAAEQPQPTAMVLATAGRDGRPSARTVLLKGLDERGLTFYTNLGSRKGREARENPHGAVVFPWVALRRQVVASGALEAIDAAESDAYFASRPHGSKLGALASPQSQVIPSREPLERARAELGRRYPDGVEVPRPEHWAGLRLVPESVEFWQGRPDRLHDRLRYRRDDGAWVIERLAP